MAGVLSYAMTLESGGFTGPLGRARGALNSTTTAAGGLLSKLSGMIGPLAGVTAGVAAMTAAKKAFTAAADFEATTTSFATLLGSTEKANAMMERIKATAATTPNTFNELTGAARSLLAVSSEAGMVDDLRMIGDLSSAAQKPIGELASMYAKILGGDQVQGEDLNMIGDALGGKALEEFAKVLGVDSIKAVRKLGSEGKISGKVLQQVFRNLTSEGGMAFGAMDAQSKTTNGLLSTLKDAIDEIFRTLGQPINDMMKPMLKDAIVWAQAFGKTLKNTIDVTKNAIANGDLGEILFRTFQVGVIKITSSFLGMFEGLGQMAGNLGTIIMDKMPTMLGGKGKSESVNIMDGIDFSGSATKDLLGLDIAEESLKNLLKRNAPDLQTMVDGFDEIEKDAQSASDAIEEATTTAKGPVGAGLGGGGGGGRDDEEKGKKIKVYNQEESLKRRFDRMSKADKESGGYDSFYDYLGAFEDVGDQRGGIGGADRGALDAFKRKNGDKGLDQRFRLESMDEKLSGGADAPSPRRGGGDAAGGGNNMLAQIRDGIFAVRDQLENVASA